MTPRCWIPAGLVAFCLLLPSPTLGQLWLNEILLSPPGDDLPHEYLELRGPSHHQMPPGTYLVVVEGDDAANPGTIQNIFDLSLQRIGGNGFLLLLQKDHPYATVPGANVLVHTGDEEGFGSGKESTLHHEGEDGQVDLENGSSSFFLIQTTNAPVLGDDLDADNDGLPDATFFASWNVLDSVGFLDNDGFGDIAYAAINFRRDPGSLASGVVVPVEFTADYLGRIGHSTGSQPEDWVASNGLEGDAPLWFLGDTTDTEPPEWSDAPLDHLGGPNFGAPLLPGILILATRQETTVEESGGIGSYQIALNTVPDSALALSLEADTQVALRIGDTGPFANAAQITLSNTEPVRVGFQARQDLAVEPSPHPGRIRHTILASGDPVHYPPETLLPDLVAGILDDDIALLSELKVNPPGSPDVPFEFIEILGLPNGELNGAKIVVLEGDEGGDPGKVSVVFDLDGQRLGSNGLLLITATNSPYIPDPATTWITSSKLNEEDGGLENGSTSFLLLTSADPIEQGDDLDKGDNGILEGLPADATILDAVGWNDGDSNDIVFGGVVLELENGTPDAASRIPGNTTPLSASAWRAGNLQGEQGESLIYDPDRSTSNTPPGTALNPGAANNSAPFITPLDSLAGAVGDPTNPEVTFQVSDAESLLQGLTLSVSSDNPDVVPDSNLFLEEQAPGDYRLHLEPIGVGYATIRVEADDGDMTGLRQFRYAASEEGTPQSRYHVGATDASTAIALSSELMIVGDDENQNLRLYWRHFSGPPLTDFDMSPFLNLLDIEDEKPREVDIEGSTRIGNRLYWTGSHSHADIGEIRTNRARIFATDLSGAGTNVHLEYVGHYEHLKDDLILWDANNLHGRGPHYYGLADSASEGVLPKEPNGAGFNIEGLTMAPGSTNTAWFCFRAPIVPATNRLFALIVPVTNFTELAISRAPRGAARFGDPIELDLQGRGIRSIEGDTNGFLLITGPPGNIPTPSPPGDFKLYTWSGNPADPPRQHSMDLTGLNPEAIVELPPHPWTEESVLQFINDNGRTIFYDDGIAGKRLPDDNFKKSRSDIFPLGPIVPPQPFFTGIALEENQLRLTWRGTVGDTYRIQGKTSLEEGSWTDLTDPLTASQVQTLTLLPLETVRPHRFFQIHLVATALHPLP